jgi:hypothetical protein
MQAPSRALQTAVERTVDLGGPIRLDANARGREPLRTGAQVREGASRQARHGANPGRSAPSPHANGGLSRAVGRARLMSLTHISPHRTQGLTTQSASTLSLIPWPRSPAPHAARTPQLSLRQANPLAPSPSPSSTPVSSQPVRSHCSSQPQPRLIHPHSCGCPCRPTLLLVLLPTTPPLKRSLSNPSAPLSPLLPPAPALPPPACSPLSPCLVSKFLIRDGGAHSPHILFDARSRRDRGTPRRALSCNASYTHLPCAEALVAIPGCALCLGPDRKSLGEERAAQLPLVHLAHGVAGQRVHEQPGPGRLRACTAVAQGGRGVGGVSVRCKSQHMLPRLWS